MNANTTKEGNGDRECEGKSMSSVDAAAQRMLSAKYAFVDSLSIPEDTGYNLYAR